MEELKDFLQESRNRKKDLSENPAHIYHHLLQFMDHITERISSTDQGIRLNAGIDAVDEITGGLRLGELAIIGGDLGSGRTTLALHYAIQTAEEQRKPVWIYTREHSAHQITVRLLSMITGVPIWTMEEGQPTEEQWRRLMTAFLWLKEQDIRVYDVYMNLDDVCDNVQAQGAPMLLIIDGADPQMLDTNALKMLGSMAKEMRCCVLLTNCRFPNADYIQGGVDKEFWLQRHGGGIHWLELTWNRYGKNGECDLRRRDDCLSFFQNPILDM